MRFLPMPVMYVYRDGKPVPLTWCSQCNSFHIEGEHGPPKLVSAA